MALQRTIVAFTFECDLSLAQMKRTLDAQCQREWTFGDSEWHRDYLGGRLTAEAVARIYAVRNGRTCHVDLRFVAEAADPEGKFKFLEAQHKLLEQVFPAIQGRNIQPAEPLG